MSKKVKNIQTIHHLFIVDESSSMSPIEEITMSGVNEQIESILEDEKKIKKQQKISFVSFNDKYKEIFFNEDVKNIDKNKLQNYNPSGMTALNDAIGKSVSKLSSLINNDKKTAVVVTIFTDGQENSSKEWTSAKVKDLLKEKQKNNWTITYVGANVNVNDIAKEYDIPLSNTMSYTSDHVGTTLAFNNITRCKQVYMRNIDTSSSSSNFFNDKDESLNLSFDQAEKLFTKDIYNKNLSPYFLD